MAEAIPNIVPADDPSLTSTMVDITGGAGVVKGFLSHPKDGKNLGAVIVIHENKGLVDHIKDVARRFAKEGFVALAPDLLSRLVLFVRGAGDCHFSGGFSRNGPSGTLRLSRRRRRAVWSLPRSATPPQTDMANCEGQSKFCARSSSARGFVRTNRLCPGSDWKRSFD